MSVAHRLATLDDLLDAERHGLACEILAGELVEKAAPDQEHGGASSAVNAVIFSRFSRGSGGRHPGGWWIRSEVDIAFSAHDVLRPDLSGWRRERLPVMPTEWPVPTPPDWVCEVLSASTAGRDLGPKRDVYHRAGVGHYWVVDRANRLLLIYRHSPGGYQLVLTGGETETLHAEPFEAVGLFVGRLFGADPPDDE